MWVTLSKILLGMSGKDEQQETEPLVSEWNAMEGSQKRPSKIHRIATGEQTLKKSPGSYFKDHIPPSFCTPSSLGFGI